MNPKTIGMVCLVFAVGFCAWSLGYTQQTALPAGQDGRYQIVPAAVDFSSTGGMPAKQTVIRVDTQTGKTWELFEQKGPVAGFETLWVPLSESR
jgi:hypothetical protein